MNKLVAALAAGLLLFAASPAAAKIDETPKDRMGDWFAALGKNKQEKSRIVAKRRLDRKVKKWGDAWNDFASKTAASAK